MRFMLCIILLMLGGCDQYSTIKEAPTNIKNITVTPGQQWNKVPAIASFGGVETWTIDGTSLDSVAFFAGIQDGKPIVKSTKKEEYPVFKADMLPNDLVELVESSLAKYYEARVTKSGTLQPVAMGTEQGFQYEFEFITPDDLTRRGFIAGIVKNGLLNLIFFQGARLYYYEHHLDNIRGMLATIRIE
ncbi:MAG: hypothetical protein EPO31_01005 [Gammaproteobacteria bacterium]|nr:MAG: hypothetical protein EPO31_01005 [Gammaproteobacteria bacterium]